MANIGYQGSDVNAPLGMLAVQLRDACHDILKSWSYINKIGVAGLQAAPYNLDASTAQATYDAYNHMQTIAAIYYGSVYQGGNNNTPGTLFNFDDSLALVRGGQ
jgi:hypothetical protein